MARGASTAQVPMPVIAWRWTVTGDRRQRLSNRTVRYRMRAALPDLEVNVVGDGGNRYGRTV
jgi:hypothetical protein